MNSNFKRIVASTLTAILVLLSPGLPFYQAWGALPSETPEHGLPGDSVPKIEVTTPLGNGAGLGSNGETFSGEFKPETLGAEGGPSADKKLETSREEIANDPIDEVAAEDLYDINRYQAIRPEAEGTSGTENSGAGKTQGGRVRAFLKPLSRFGKTGADRGGVLSWFFDRFSSKKGSPSSKESLQSASSDDPARAQATIAANESSNPAVNTLHAASKSNETGGTAQSSADPVPSPSSSVAGDPSPKSPLGKFFGKIYKAFDLSGYNRSEKAYLLGQTIFLLGLAMYSASLPLLVQAITGHAQDTGTARMVHYFVLAGASLFAGRVVSKMPMPRVLRLAGSVRAGVFLSIGALTLSGLLPGILPMWVFYALIALNGYAVAHNTVVDLDEAGAAMVLNSKEKVEKSGYTYDFLFNASSIILPPLFGLLMDFLDKNVGAGVGPKVVIGLFGLMLTGAVHMYKRVQPLHAYEPDKKSLGLWATLKLIWHNKTVRVRALLMSMENFLEDALFSVVLPTYALEKLKAGGFGSTLLFSSKQLGGLLSSLWLIRYAQAMQKKIGTYRFMNGLTVAAALAFIPSIGLWMFPSLPVAVLAAFLMKALYQPIRSRMRSLLQNSINEDPETKNYQAEIFSVGNIFAVTAAGVGAGVFKWLFDHSGPKAFLTSVLGIDAPMKVVSIALASMSLVYLIGLQWMKPHLRQAEYKVHHSEEGMEAKAMARLEVSLKRMGLPAYQTVTVEEAVSPDRPTVAILAAPSIYKLAIVQEGGRQSPGDVHLVLDPSWITQEIGPDGKNYLLLSKGLYFDKDGQAVIATYKTARRVRYFANFYTPGATDRSDGIALEENLDVPMSSSFALEKVTNDKLWTRLMLAARGVAVPATLAFLMAGHPLLANSSRTGTEQVRVTAMPKSREDIRQGVLEFLSHYQGAEVVVKPSGPQYHSGLGVKFFARDQVDAIVNHVIELSKDPRMEEQGAVLIDQRLTPPPVYLRIGRYEGHGAFGYRGEKVSIRILNPSEIAGAAASEKKDSNIRILVGRAPWDGAVTMGMFARAGTWGLPTTAEPSNPENAAAIIRVEDFLEALKKQHGILTTESEMKAFMEELDALGKNAMTAILDNESKLERKPGEPFQAQTEAIGLDVMLELENGKLVPKIIEVNDHDGGGQHEMDVFYPEDRGLHSREWMATMLERARLDALRGKRIVLVGSGPISKKPIIDEARKLGIKIIMIDRGYAGLKRIASKMLSPFGILKDNWSRDLVSEFIAADVTQPEQALAAAREKLLFSQSKNGKLDGIDTYYEDDVVLTAMIAEAMGMPYHSVKTAKTARNKFQTYAAMKEAGLRTPAHAELKTRQDLENVLRNGFPFPAVLKPEWGAEAQYTVKVHSPEEALSVYDRVSDRLGQIRNSSQNGFGYLSQIRAFFKSKSSYVDPIFKQGIEFVLVEYLEGREWDMNAAQQGGKALYDTITDNWPTKEPNFLATGSSKPSVVLNHDEQEAIKELGWKTLKDAVGATDGVYHVEGKTTVKGPYIIEVNLRMGGGGYVTKWDQAVDGVDAVRQFYLIAARIPAGPYKSPKPLTYLSGAFLNSDVSGRLERLEGIDEIRSHPGFHEVLIYKKPGAQIQAPPDGYTARIAMLQAKGDSAEEAHRNLAHITFRVNYQVSPYESKQGSFARIMSFFGIN